MIKHDLRVGEEMKIGGTTLRMVKKSGQVATILIDAPADVKIEFSKRREDSQNKVNHVTTS